MGFIPFELNESGLQPFPSLGMRSGAGGLVNPGLSIWAFSAPAHLLGLQNPMDLARFVGVMSVVAMLLMGIYVWFQSSLTSLEKQAWLWGIVLTLANPLMLLYSRKIWAQSLLPLFLVILLIAWMERRRHFLFVVLYAVMAVLIGQLHMSGFFWGAIVLLWGLRESRGRVSQLLPLISGALLGLVPLVPWLQEILNPSSSAQLQGALKGNLSDIPEIFKFRFWGHVASLGSGLHLPTVLGPHFKDLLMRPLALLSYFVAGVATLALLIPVLRSLFKAEVWKQIFSLRRRELSSQTETLLWLALIALGLLMTFSNVRIHRHYLIVVTPLLGVGAAWIALHFYPRFARILLSLLVLSQGILGFETLRFLKDTRGAPRGDFGRPYEDLTPQKIENLIKSVSPSGRS